MKSLYVMQKELERCIQRQDDLDRAAIALDTRSGEFRELSQSCREAAEDYRKEGTDWYCKIEEEKIRLEKEKNVQG